MTKDWWPRLISQPQKPAWLKIDFDRWESEDLNDDDDVRDVREDYPNSYDQLQREEFGYKKGTFKGLPINNFTNKLYLQKTLKGCT